MRKGVRQAGESGGVAFTPEGFTLIEVLLALVLLSVILGAIYSTFILSHKAMEGMDQSLVKLQECRMAIDAIRREIESISYTPGREKTVFRIEDRDLYGKQASRFSFQTFSPLLPGA
jgi:general secretion pathway protein J